MPEQQNTGENAVQDPNQNTDQQGGSDAGNQQQGGDQTVPVSALQRERQARQEEQRRREQLEQRFSQVEQMQQSQQSQQSSQQSQDPLEGLDDDEPLTAGQVRQIRQQDKQQSEAVLQEIQMRQNYTDYDEVIQNYLPQKLQENPRLEQAILSSRDPFTLAYEMGKEYKNRAPSGGQETSGSSGGGGDQSELAQALDRNQNTPGSASQAASSTQSPPSGTERITEAARRSPAELDEMIRKAKRGEA